MPTFWPFRNRYMYLNVNDLYLTIIFASWPTSWIFDSNRQKFIYLSRLLMPLDLTATFKMFSCKKMIQAFFRRFLIISNFKNDQWFCRITWGALWSKYCSNSWSDPSKSQIEPAILGKYLHSNIFRLSLKISISRYLLKKLFDGKFES